MAFVRQRPPDWFWTVSFLLALWGVLACYVGVRLFLYGPDLFGTADPYRRALFAALPGWYDYVYALAAVTALLGAVALLRRCVVARLLFLVSFAAIAVRFAWLFATTDVLIVRGLTTGAVALAILGVAFYSTRFAAKARRHGWIC